MKPITRDEVMGLSDYETIRERFRARVIEEKRLRRVSVGPHVTLLFENRDTVLLQIQEMLRTERITKETAILHEIETYNELVPGFGELSATLMIEIADKETRDRFLIEAKGLERSVQLDVGGHLARALGQARDETADRTTAVHYLKFALGKEAQEAARTGKPEVRLLLDHPAYQAEARLPPAVRKALLEDLFG